MKLDEFSKKDKGKLEEGAFDSMVDQLGEPSKKGPGRWPNGKKETPGSNYSGDKANDKNGNGQGVGPSVKRKKDLDQLSGPKKKVKEATGDPSFDKMMGNISGSDTPSVDLSNRQTVPDRKIMDLTHKIFLRLQEYDDPEVYQKFIQFMIKTITANAGPLDESKFR